MMDLKVISMAYIPLCAKRAKNLVTIILLGDLYWYNGPLLSNQT